MYRHIAKIVKNDQLGSNRGHRYIQNCFVSLVTKRFIKRSRCTNLQVPSTLQCVLSLQHFTNHPVCPNDHDATKCEKITFGINALSYESPRGKTNKLWFPNRSDTNRLVQAQKRARSLKFRI